MSKISITVDVAKLRDCKVHERSYKKDDEEVKIQEMKLEVVALKEKKLLKEGDTWKLYKTHFVAEKKEDKEAETNYVGEGVMFESNEL